MYLFKANQANFCAVYEDMQKQFPYIELKAKETFLTLRRQTQYHIWLVKDTTADKPRTVGYMLVWLDTLNRVTWLEYIAVLQPYHNRGLGGQMLCLLKDKYPGCKGCFLELEKPFVQDKNAQRRVSFYTRRGAFALDILYFCPQPTKPSLEMDLYFLPFRPGIRRLPDHAVLGAVRQAYRTLHTRMPQAQKMLRYIKPLFKRKDAFKQP